MGIAHYYAIIIFLLMIFLSISGLRQRQSKRVFKVFMICTLIIALVFLYFSFNITDKTNLYSIYAIYLGILFIILGNFFTQSLGKIVAKMFTSNQSINDYRVRTKIGILSIVIGLIFIGLAFSDFQNHYLLLILIGTFLPLFGILLVAAIIKFSKV